MSSNNESTNDESVAGLSSRRAFLSTAVLGATGLVVAAGSMPAALASAVSATSSPRRTSLADATSCMTMTPTQEIGPFYVNYDKVRSNIRSSQPGIPFTVHIKVINVATCKPIHNAALDVWHANAVGVYSDESSENTVGHDWLRGVQLTDKAGKVTFKTIMPGWYEGRVTHIHAKVRLKGTTDNGLYTGGTTTHIGQMFFSQKINDACAAISPYTTNTQSRITNSTDRVYTQQGGTSCVFSMSGSTSKGYVGRITVGVSP